MVLTTMRAGMEKLIITYLSLLAVLVSFQSSYASSPYISYEVTEIVSNGLVVRNSQSEQVFFKESSGQLKKSSFQQLDENGFSQE